MNHLQIVKYPYPAYLRRVLIRSMVMWVLVRVFSVFVLAGGSSAMRATTTGSITDAVLHPVWAVRLLLLFLTTFLVRLDRKIAHECLLQANFGNADRWFFTTSLLGAGLADIVVQTIIAITVG